MKGTGKPRSPFRTTQRTTESTMTEPDTVISSTVHHRVVPRKLSPPPPASSEAIHRTMVSNRGKNTGPEKILRRALRRRGITGYRMNRKGVPGRPDVTFSEYRLAIFVNGCFWHRCPRCGLPLPKTNRAFWKRKFEMNVERDARKRKELKTAGWQVITIWECEIKSDVDRCVRRIERSLNTHRPNRRLPRRPSSTRSCKRTPAWRRPPRTSSAGRARTSERKRG